MRNHYILYPSAFEKLDSSGINQRIKDTYQRGDISIGGFVSESDVISMAKEMREGGVFNHLSDEDKDFLKKINSVFRSPQNFSWTIKRTGEEMKEEVEMEDVIAMMGWWSHLTLNSSEVFDYRKFGFDNLMDFTGSVAALANNVTYPSFRNGYVWTTKDSNGKIFVNEITGDHNADLRVFRRDNTPYDTLDPLGNKVSYRPEMKEDVHGVFGYHSTEDAFLVTILKWVEQCNIKSETLEDKAKGAIEWAKSLGQRGGFTAEHSFGEANDLRTRTVFNLGVNLPQLSKKGECEQLTSYGVVSNSDVYYGAYVDQKNNLVFVSETKNERPSPIKKTMTSFMPEEADHLIKGIIYQSAKGLGRTSAAQLTSVLKYRFSPEYESDLRDLQSRG